MSAILRIEEVPNQTRTSMWDELITELETTPLNGRAGLLFEGLDRVEARSKEQSLRSTFRRRGILNFRPSVIKVGNAFNVYVREKDVNSTNGTV